MKVFHRFEQKICSIFRRFGGIFTFVFDKFLAGTFFFKEITFGFWQSKQTNDEANDCAECGEDESSALTREIGDFRLFQAQLLVFLDESADFVGEVFVAEGVF